MLKESLRVWVLDGEGNKVAFPNDKEQAVLSNWQYTAERMAGAPTITDSIMHTQCLDDLWTKKEFVELNEERFYISQVPTSEKDTDDIRYEHKVTFVSERSILENVFFFDCVTKETGAQASDKPRSNTTDFSFFGTLTELVERLNDSLSYSHLYDAEGVNGFRIVIDGDIADTEAKEVTISDAYFATAMQEIYNVFDIPYYWDGKTCHVGFAKNEIEEPFEYGKDKGLLSVTKENSDFRIINRITGMGSSDNIPYYYPNDDPNGLAIFDTRNFAKELVDSVSLSVLYKYTTDIYGLELTLCKNKQEMYSANLLEHPVMFVNVVHTPTLGSGLRTISLDGTPTKLAAKADDVFMLNAYLGTLVEQGVDVKDSTFYSQFMYCYLIAEINAIGVNDSIDFSDFVFNAVAVKGYKDNKDNSATSTFAPNVNFSYEYAVYVGEGMDGFDMSDLLSEKVFSNRYDDFGTTIEDSRITAYINSSSKEHVFVRSGKHAVLIECKITCDIARGNGMFVEVTAEPKGSLNYKYNVGEQYFAALPSGKTIPLSEGVIKVSNISDVPVALVDYSFDGEKWLASDLVAASESAAKVIIEGRDYINPISKLMPSIYRSSKGDERFYNALDDTYILEGETIYHKFTNPFVEGEPKEGIQNFEEIKPTINGITNAQGQLFGEVADIAFDDDDNDDFVVSDGEQNSTADAVHGYFYVKLNVYNGEYGFNLFKQGLAQGAMTFNFISGSCAGCAFEVGVPEGKQVGNHYEFVNPVQVDVKGNIVGGNFEDKVKEGNPMDSQQDTSTNSVWIALKKDNSTFGVLMPNVTNNYRPKAGDKFVITNILMPKAYITAAEKRLESALIKYMSENNDEKFTFSIKFSRIYLQRNPDIAESINENSKIHVKYNGHDYPLYVSSYSRKCDDNILDEVSVELSENLTITQSKSQQQMNSILGNVNEQINSALKNQGGSGNAQSGNVDLAEVHKLVYDKLSRIANDIANGKITFMKGADFGTFVKGLLGGTGGSIDQYGNAELESLIVRQFIETPEFRQNKIDVVSGELWNSICFGTIESVDVKRRIAVLKLQDGELSGIKAGDICRGIFHCLEADNPSESIVDDCGFLQLAGFSTSYFTPTEVYDNGASFKYSLRQGTSVHPQVGMKFAVYGSFTDKSRRASAYMTRTYTRYLNNVDTWQIRPDVHIYGQQGDIEGLTINGVEMHGYGAYLHNLYLSGVHIEFDRDWIDHNIPKTYNVVLTTYERTVVTDIEGNPLTGLEEIRNIISEDGNVVSGESNVIANRLALTTTIQASKGSTPLLYSDIMDEGKFVVSLQCIGCTAKCENGVVMVTSLDMESMEHQVVIEVNCEGEAVYQQIFNVPVVKQGENGVTADLDNEMATIAANDKGKPIVEPFEEIVSHGRLWYGNDEMYLVKAEVAVPGGITVADVTTVTDEEGQHNYLPIIDNKYCTLRITNVGEDAADISQIRIEMFGRIKEQMNTEYSKVVVFTLNKVRMGENAQNYSLLTTSPIMQADGKGNVTTTQVACSVLASDGKSMTELTTAEELKEHTLTMKVQLYNANDAVSEEVAYTIGTNLVVGTSTIGGLKLTKDSVRLVFLLYWQGLLIDKEGIPMIKDGSSTVRIDLDNENDSILYNDAGEKVSSDCYTNIKVYDGSKNVTSSCILSIDYGSYVSAYISGTQCYVTSVSSTTGYARIAAYYPADGNTYYAIFSIKRLVGEDKYEIVTSPTTVSYDPNKKEYSATSVKVDVYRTDQNGVRSIISSSNTLPSGYALQYSSDGSVWAAISAGSSVTPDYTLPNIFLRIVDNNGKVRDSETVPVVIGGSDSTSYWLISPVSTFSLSPSGSYTPPSFSVTMKKKTGEGEVENCSDFYLSVWGVGSNRSVGYISHKSEKSYSIDVAHPSSSSSYTSLLVVASSDVPSSNNYPSKIVAELGIGIVTDGKAGEAGNSIFLIDKGIFKQGQSYKFDKMEGVDNAYERDWVLHNPGGGSYYAYAVKSMGTTVSTAPSVAGGSDNNWEFLNKHESVLADTLIGVNCNIGGFAVTNEQFASQNYLTNDAGICINGKNGEIIAKQSSTSEWKVDTSGNMSIGNPSGQRIVVNPETKDIKVFDASDNLVTTISGETVSSISNLFGSAGSISAVSAAMREYSGSGSIQTEKEYITISNYFSADAGAKLSASCSLYLSASLYTDSGGTSKPQIMGNSISARIVYTDYYNVVYGAITGSFSVVGDVMSGGAGSNTLKGSAIVKSSGNYYVKLEVKYAVGASYSNKVVISNITPSGLSLVVNNYLSRLLANGFCFGSTNANYIAALNESSGNMHFDFKSGSTQLELTNSNFVLKSQYGKVFPTILWAYCSSTSVRQYYTSTGGEPKRSSSSSTGIFVLDLSSCNFDTDLSPNNAIFTLTPILGNCRTMQIGNIDTSTPKLIPILSFDGNGNAADAWFTIQVQRII